MLHEDLRYFCAVAEELNITRVAERLYLSQQTLSHRIARLESEYHVTLFERKPKLALTAAGRRFYEYAQRVLSQDAELFSQFGEVASQEDKKLTIGITQTRSMTYLPTVMPEFKALYPDIICDVRVCHVCELEKRLLAGEFDLIITPDASISAENIENADLVRVLVQDDPICLTIPRALLRSFINDKEINALAALPPAEALKLLHKQGILARLPYALPDARLSQTARNFLRRYVPAPHITTDLHNTEIVFAAPFAEAEATFLSRSVLARIALQSAPLTIDIGHNPVSAVYCRHTKTEPMEKFIALAQSKMGQE